MGLKSDNCQTKWRLTSEGMHMKNTNVVKNRTKVLRNVDRSMENWMKHHSVQDLRDLAFEMYNRGEDITCMIDLIHEMDDMAIHANVYSKDSVAAYTEYDILTYVDEVEHAVV